MTHRKMRVVRPLRPSRYGIVMYAVDTADLRSLPASSGARTLTVLPTERWET